MSTQLAESPLLPGHKDPPTGNRAFTGPFRVVDFSNAHHARHSGYHRLSDYLPVHKPLSWDGPRIGRWFTTRAYHRLVRPHCALEYYSKRSFFTEMAVCKEAFRTRRQLFHFIYGENQFWLSHRIKGLRGTKTVATYHQPESLLERVLGGGYADRSPDAAIVVARGQMAFFQAMIGDTNTHFVPHGIDTDFFQPSGLNKESTGRPRRCLFVGNWLRDFQTMNEILRTSAKRKLDIEFTAITLPSRAADIQGPNLRIVSAVPDEELVEWYRWADLTVLPLLDCTANNALLESLACGTPVVVSDFGGTRDYANEKCGVFTPPGDAVEMVRAIELLHGNTDILNQMAVAARARAMEFDWRRVAAQTCEVYERVMMS
jgi:glycosyltransferase involved in cell wall biosynthesis